MWNCVKQPPLNATEKHGHTITIKCRVLEVRNNNKKAVFPLERVKRSCIQIDGTTQWLGHLLVTPLLSKVTWITRGQVQCKRMVVLAADCEPWREASAYHGGLCSKLLDTSSPQGPFLPSPPPCAPPCRLWTSGLWKDSGDEIVKPLGVLLGVHCGDLRSGPMFDSLCGMSGFLLGIIML